MIQLLVVISIRLSSKYFDRVLENSSMIIGHVPIRAKLPDVKFTNPRDSLGEVFSFRTGLILLALEVCF